MKHLLLLSITLFTLSQTLFSQHVGIGTTDPDTTLHVVGSIKMEDGHEQSNYLLTSDSSGVAQWQVNNAKNGVVIGDCIKYEVADAAQTSSNLFGDADFWQEVIPESTGYLSGLSFRFTGTTGTVILSIFDGTGIGGTMLYTDTVGVTAGPGFHRIDISPFPGVTMDTPFTFHMEIAGDIETYAKSGDVYPGASSYGATVDAQFLSFVAPCTGDDYVIDPPTNQGTTGLNHISAINFSDGTMQSTADKDEQTLSIRNDTIIISNGNQIVLPSANASDGVILDDCTEFEDAENNTGGISSASAPGIWQEVIPDSSGLLIGVELKLKNQGISGGILAIYEGIGTGGALLYSGNASAPDTGWQRFDIYPGVPVMSGVSYTFQMQNTSGVLFHTNFSIYPGASSMGNPDADWQFKTHLNPCLSPNYIISPPTSGGTANLNHIDTIFFADGSFKTTAVPSLLTDADEDTRIDVEQSSDEDVIRMSLAGIESLTIERSDSGSTMMVFPNNNNNIFLGKDAGRNATSGSSNIAIGTGSQIGLTTGNQNTSVGYESLGDVNTGVHNTAVGYRAMINADGFINTAVGSGALQHTTGASNIAVGYLALRDLEDGSDNVVVGRGAMRDNISGSGNVALGNQAGYYETGSNKLYIANTGADSSEALVYGEFDNALLAINGTLRVNDGTQAAGSILTSDADGNATWVAPVVSSFVADADDDTKIQVEQSPDEDIIRMTLAGLESLTIFRSDSGRAIIDIPNNNNNIFLGADAGLNASTGVNNVAIGKSSQAGLSTGSHNTSIGLESLIGVGSGTQNTAVGYRAMNLGGGSLNTAMGTSAMQYASGSGNVGVGYLAQRFLETGSDNVAIGRASLRDNTSGSGNVALGTLAGALETGSNTLYIANSGVDSSQALIYGEFDNAWLRVNGRLTPTEGISDSDGDTKIQVEESSDEDTIRFDLAGVESFVFGPSRINIKSASSSLYLGDNAGSANTTGAQNTLLGYHSGKELTSGAFNVAVGTGAMPVNTTGGANVAVGASALPASLTGIRNTALGYQSLRANIAGNENVAVGFRAGDANNGSFNVFLGNKAGFNELGSYKLYIESTDADSNAALIFGNFATNWLKINGHLSASEGFADTDNDTKIQVEESADEDIIRFDVQGTQAMMINNNGHIGMGTGASSSYRLNVNNQAQIGQALTGTIPSTGIAGFGHKDQDALDEVGFLQDNVGNTTIQANQNRNIAFNLNGTNVAYFRDDPNIGGFFFNYGPATGYAFNMTNSGSPGVGIPNSGLKITAGHNVNNGADSPMIGFYRPDGTEIGKIIQNNSNTVFYSTTSDIRLKTGIQPTHYSIDDLMQIEVRDYVYRDEPDDPQVGFIAQQLYEHYPLAVTPGGDDAKTNPWMVDYSKLTPLIVKAVQDQQQQIDLLKEQNALLLQEIEQLKSK